jgi:HlyD family secretion protein
VVGADNRDQALKPGMTAATRIVTGQRGDVLRVPNQALRYAPGGLAADTANGHASPAAAANADGKNAARVWVLRDGVLSPVAVRTGLDDDNFTEIVAGDLRVGDQLVVAGQRSGNGRPAEPP